MHTISYKYCEIVCRNGLASLFLVILTCQLSVTIIKLEFIIICRHLLLYTHVFQRIFDNIAMTEIFVISLNNEHCFWL